MADAIVSAVLKQLASITQTEIEKQVKLVVGSKKEIEKITSTLTSIRAMLNDAEKKQVKDNSAKVWLEKLKDISYDLDDVLDEWNTKIHQEERPARPRRRYVGFISPCSCFNQASFRHDIGLKIRDIRDRLESIALERDSYKFDLVDTNEEVERRETSHLIDVSEVCGRDLDKETIVSKLCETSSQDQESGLTVISICGMGGIGKTTLAQVAFNDDKVKSFFEKTIWVCVSEPFDEMQIVKRILEAVGLDVYEFLRWPNLQELLSRSIAGMKFLLVLDDVWTDDYKKWEPLKLPLKNGAQGSKVLVTTRNERVSKMMEATFMLPLGKLSVEVSWSLFSRLAFYGKGREECCHLEEIGRKIADKCKGLPLAVKTLGSLLRFKETKQDWQNVLDSETWELEEVEKGIFPPLFLSYYDLSSPMKRCFSYCAIFPKDYEIEKDTLIKLWMAQGFLGSSGSIEMELKGAEYFDNLVMRSFFQDLERDKDGGGVISCKMHDIVHDFAQFLTKNECFILEVDVNKEQWIDDSSRTRARHLTMIGVREGQFRPSIYKVTNLRTLQVLQMKTTRAPRALFEHLTSLRALDLSHTSIERLPSEIDKLMHLRYLDLSYLDIEELPDALCSLYNLQTLNLDWCKRLQRLPRGLGNLGNLRHLNLEWTDWLSTFPQGIGRLSSLRSLTKFIVSSNREGCKIGELKDLNHLRGNLEISGLEMVSDVEEAQKADLLSKKHLRSLDLVFSFGVKEVMEKVLEVLQPHPNLEALQLYDYRGSVFPAWTMTLTGLKDLKLLSCENCSRLPPLGKLPSLEKLLIGHFNNLKCLGGEFLGLTGGDTGSLTVFPKLKKLTFRVMMEWEEWDASTTTTSDASTSSSSNNSTTRSSLIIFPNLQSLSLYDCPKLKTKLENLQMISVEELVIRRCPVLEQHYQRDVGEGWSQISHIPDIQI